MKSQQDDSSLQEEIADIKRAMRVAHARRHVLRQAKEEEDIGMKSLKTENKTLSRQFQELNDRLKEKDEQIKELRYELSHVSQTRSLEFSELMTEKKNAALEALKVSLERLEATVETQRSDLNTELERSLRLISGIERSLESTPAYRVSSELVIAARRSVNAAKDIIHRHSHSVESKSKHVPSDSLDGTLFDLCRNLEEENLKLQSLVSSQRKELEENSRELSISKLIPHYRLAIVRSRDLAANLQEQLHAEKENNQLLKEQIEQLFAELRQTRLETKETSKYSNDAIGQYNGPHRHTRIVNPVVFDNGNGGLRHNRDIDNILLSKESEILDLNSEINLLKSHLEKAALAQTHKIISDVIGKVR